MYSWNIGSMRKSMLYDVINLIDRAHWAFYAKSDPISPEESEFLSKPVINELNDLYNEALSFESIISVMFYIPAYESEKGLNTVFMLTFKDIAFALHSVDELIDSIRGAEKNRIKDNILHYSLISDTNDVSEDFFKNVIRDIKINPVKGLNETRLPASVKFSLSSAILDYDSFLDSLIFYIAKIYLAVSKFYNKHKDVYVHVYRILRDYLSENDSPPLLAPETVRALKGRDRSFLYVLMLVCTKYSRVFYEDSRVVCAKGLRAVIRELHVEGFTLF